MVARKRKSKKPSAVNSRPPENRPVLFIDRNLGRHVLSDNLRKAGIPCEVHDDHLPQDATDEDWLQLVGEKGWIAIGRDKNIRYREPEKAALIDANAKLIVVRAKNTTGQDIADILIKHINRIYRFVDKHDAPFIAGITRDGKITKYPL
jgi:predicted nuclease of predicted toxin-antitoxin system